MSAVAGSAFSASTVCQPFIAGMNRSRMMTAGRSDAASCTASVPVGATIAR